MKTVERDLCVFLAVLVVMTACGCGRLEEEAASQAASSPSDASPTASAAPKDAAAEREAVRLEPTPAAKAAPAPSPEEVRQALTRVYKGVVVIDQSRSPSFLAGDLNGDGSEDLVVVVKPAAGKLAELNSEIANWVIEDPQKVFVPDLHRGINVIPRKPPPVRVSAGDVLLAVIHGYGAAGWRNPQATQTYLLKNAAGSKLEVWPRKQVLAAGKGDRSFPAIRGDVLGGVFGQSRGFVYWSGGDYALYQER